MAVKLQQLLNMTAREIAQLPSSELRDTYQNLRKIVRSRVNTFSKHGITDVVPASLRGGLGSSKGRTDQDLLQDIRQSTAWMRGKRSSYRGYQEVREDFRSKMQESMPDLDLSDTQKLDSYGEFMGDMQERYGEMWHSISNQARDIYREAVRLNMNPKSVMRNYDYWADHISDLENADPIKTKKDRQLRPSEYARKLGLEKIGGGRRK